MQQVLFRIPIKFGLAPDGIPIYGFGMMLFLAFVVCLWVTGRRAEKRKVPKEAVQDLALWLFGAGLIGARMVYMYQYNVRWLDFYKIWEGGIVFYGSLAGGAAGFFVAHRLIFRKLGVSRWQLADIISPSLALGLAIGRIGCYLNGCCYGNVACPECAAVHFPLSAPPRYTLTDRGWQTAAGFMLVDPAAADARTVKAVEPHSVAHAKGLQPGDIIVKANDRDIASYEDLHAYLASFEGWPRGQKDLSLTVLREGKEIPLGTMKPETLGLHPTQIYETISMILLFLLMLAFEPFKKREGQVTLVFLICYPIHRFLNEMLRNDTDPVLRDLTLSQTGSILVFAIGLILFLWTWRQPVVAKRAVV